MNGLFHRDVYLPPETKQIANKTFDLVLSRHAETACQSDRYGLIEPPKTVTVTANNIIELEVVNGLVSKVVVRQPYDDKRDIIIVFIPSAKQSLVKTFWINLKSDTHKTLDRARYNNKP